jgi:hypothetical protein
MKIQAARTSHESNKLRGEHDFQKAHFSQDKIKEDFRNARNGDNFVVITSDLQQALPTPHIATNVVFYFRQLWTYNLCTHNSTKQSYVHTWSEDQASRGPGKVVSCLNNYIHTTCDKGGLQNARSLTAWSDSCAGQNKNK